MTGEATKQVADFLNNPTFLGLILLLFFVVMVGGGLREWWVFGREYRRVLRENEALHNEIEYWQNTALNTLTLARHASDQAVEVVRRDRNDRTVARRDRQDRADRDREARDRVE